MVNSSGLCGICCITATSKKRGANLSAQYTCEQTCRSAKKSFNRLVRFCWLSSRYLLHWTRGPERKPQSLRVRLRNLLRQTIGAHLTLGLTMTVTTRVLKRPFGHRQCVRAHSDHVSRDTLCLRIQDSVYGHITCLQTHRKVYGHVAFEPLLRIWQHPWEDRYTLPSRL